MKLQRSVRNSPSKNRSPRPALAGLARTLGLIALLLGGSPAVPAATRRIHSNPPAAPSDTIAILPSATDPAIKTFDSPHYLYVDRDIVVAHRPKLPPDRHELLLWLTGTKGEGAGPAAFCELAAHLGYHVIVLMYPDAVAATVCKRDPDPQAFEKFRLAIIEGGASRHLTIARAESIENRLAKLLRFLATNRADEHWEQFLAADGAINWSAVAVAGQSQGGGHAALIAIRHRVARVVCTGAPKDYSLALDQPAAWYRLPSATPKDRFFAFNHQQDGSNGCTFEQQLKNLQALQLDEFGAPVDVDTTPPPYRGAHILTTNIPAPNPHVSVINTRNAAHFEKVWAYLLTATHP